MGNTSCTSCKHVKHAQPCKRQVNSRNYSKTCDCEYAHGHAAHHGQPCKLLIKKQTTERIPTKYADFEENESVYKGEKRKIQEKKIRYVSCSKIETKSVYRTAEELSDYYSKDFTIGAWGTEERFITTMEPEECMEEREVDERVIDHYIKKTVRRPIEWTEKTNESFEVCHCQCKCSEICSKTVMCGCKQEDHSEKPWAKGLEATIAVGIFMTILLVIGLLSQLGSKNMYDVTKACENLDWDYKKVVTRPEDVSNMLMAFAGILILDGLYKWFNIKPIEEYHHAAHWIKMTIANIIILISLLAFLLWKFSSQASSPWNGYYKSFGYFETCMFSLGDGTTGLFYCAIFTGLHLIFGVCTLYLEVTGWRIGSRLKSSSDYESL